MIKALLLMGIFISCFWGIKEYYSIFNKTTVFTGAERENFKIDSTSLNRIKTLLQDQAPTLKPEVIQEVLTTLTCANQHGVSHNSVLTIIDFSLPSSEKRLWIFDLEKRKLLFHTYVSHGINSGALLSEYFSNKGNSKASSIGVYNTGDPYLGRHGLSLKLYGLDKNFNDNAYNRFIVVHGSWYVDENFVKKYGRVGRSWGCPTVPVQLTKPIIDTIKENSLLVAYYPNDWLQKSKFTNCNPLQKQNGEKAKKVISVTKEEEQRASILFADINNNHKHEENEPILAITAENYLQTFNTKVPLNRMLRRQIDNTEYIALSHTELEKVDHSTIRFVIPVVKLQRGYYATEMKIIEKKSSIPPRSTDRFIRWIGL